MSDEPKSSEEVAALVSDGATVDWDDALRRTKGESDRNLLRQLRLMEGVARIHAGVADGPSAWGHLTLREKIGAGSFGELYCAWDSRLDREVALKLLDPDTASSGEARSTTVLKEGRLLARLRHPNVVTVHGADVHAGQVGVWMELIRGRSLEEILRENGPMGAREAAGIGVDLCRALAAVHGTGIVHRDVKTQNVMRETGGRIVLMDFGAGVEVRPDRFDPDAGMTGSPSYMAPEVLRGEPATARSDLYALGVLLFRLVTGRFPIEASSWEGLVGKHARREVTLLRDARPDLPEGFVAVVERAIDPDPAVRFASAGEMEQALVKSTGGAAPDASPAPKSNRSGLRTLLIVVLLGSAAAWGAMRLLPRGGSVSGSRPPSPTEKAPAAGNAVVATPTPGPYSIDATLYRMPAGSDVRESIEPGTRIALGDRLTLEVRASAPLYVYVVDEDEAGHAYALFPLPDVDEQNPLRPDTSHRLPGRRGGKELSWTVDTAGGREHLLVLASPQRLDEYESEMQGLERPGLTAVALSDAARLRLRGLGSLSESPSPGATQSSGRLFEMAQRLAAGSQVVSGVWMRRIDLDNPKD